MGHGFTWISAIPGLNLLPEHFVMAVLVAAGLLWVAARARRQLTAAADPVVPDATLTTRTAAEMYVDAFSSIVEDVVGHHSRKYVPLFGAIFIFILFSNLSGLIPGFSPPTAHVSTTFALGLLSFVMYNVYGFQAHGAGYLKHFLGPIWWLAVLMLPLELIDNFLRPITLNLRLLMNMTADHMVLDIFTDLTKLVIPVVFLMLGSFVSLIQAFVFTLLSLVYVALAVGGHDEHEEH